jgi:hypothetical protein
MEQDPFWEASSYSSSQELPYILENQKAHLWFYKRLPFVDIPNQTNPVYPFLFPENAF